MIVYEKIELFISKRVYSNHHSGVAETDAAITPQRNLGSWQFWYRSTRSKTLNAQIVIMQFRIFVALGLGAGHIMMYALVVERKFFYAHVGIKGGWLGQIQSRKTAGRFKFTKLTTYIRSQPALLHKCIPKYGKSHKKVYPSSPCYWCLFKNYGP